MKSLNKILKSDSPSGYLYGYAYKNGRLEPKWEKLLLSLEDPFWLYMYARDIIKDRWLEAEEYIKKDPEYAHFYAKNVIKGRWPEAEEYIKKDSRWACRYAENIIKGRWKEAEEYIKRYLYWWQLYCGHFDIKE